MSNTFSSYSSSFRHLARVYATNHPEMASPTTQPCFPGDNKFGDKGGVTNGAEWYSVQGGERHRELPTSAGLILLASCSCQLFVFSLGFFTFFLLWISEEVLGYIVFSGSAG